MNKKRDLMNRKLISVYMNKNKKKIPSLNAVSIEQIMSIKSLPMAMRKLLVKFKESNDTVDLQAITDELKDLNIESEAENLSITDEVDPANYDPSINVNKIIDEFTGETDSEYYTEAELREFFTDDVKAGALIAVVNKVKKLIPEDKKIDIQVLTSIAKQYVVKKSK